MESIINTCLELAGPVRPLALYSHLLPAIVSIVLAFFVYQLSDRKSKNIFVLFVAILSLWLIGDLVAWHSNNYYLVGAFWSTLDYLNILFYILITCFFIAQIRKNDTLPLSVIAISIVVAIPPLLLTIAGLAVGEFDQTNCEMAGNDLLAKYKLIVEWLSIAVIFSVGLITIIKSWNDIAKRNQFFVLTASSVIFLGIFSSSEYIATLTDIYEINLYALFSLPIFLVILTFSIIEQGAFKLRGDSFLLAKLLFFIFILVAFFNLVLADDSIEFLVTGASTIVTTGFGLLLLRSAKREVKQREEIEKLATGLESANERLRVLDKQKSEFVSIASHQLRSPLTAIRGYVSMIKEGSFGEVSDKMKEALNRIDESGHFMASSIDDFLNVSRIESGNMKYDYSNIDIVDMSKKVVEDLQADATNRGLLLLYRTNITEPNITSYADGGKVQQILHNLINNSLKYTKKGTVTVYVHNNTDTKKLMVEIIDTGIGMSEETLSKIFGKFSRAKIASSANIMGTGLGLFVAREMARAMKGDITAHSEGEGKGSRFIFTIPYDTGHGAIEVRS